MNWQKKRPADEEAELPAGSAGKPGMGGGKKTQGSHHVLGFLPPAWNRDWLFALLLVFGTMAAYLPVFHAGFIWNDDSFLTDNLIIRSADGLYRMWFTASTPDYFPMTSGMLWLEWRIWGNHPLGYHVVNVLLHALSAVLLWRVLRRLKIPGAMLAAAIFALHPVNVESVAWITERKNTLAMFFYVSTLLAWLKFEDSGRRRWYELALAGFTLALLSKTAVAPLPVVLMGIAWWRRGQVGWKDVWRVVPFFVIAVVLAVVTVWFQYHQSIAHEIIRTDGFWSRLAGAGWAVWFYLYKVVLPLNLAFVYPRWEINPRNVVTYIPLVSLAAVIVLCWRGRKRCGRALFFALAYFVVMLLPILGFLNIYFMRYSLVADHWQYFAIIGPIVLAAAIIRRPMVAAALLLVLGTLTWKQCGMYVNDEKLWVTTLRLNPQCWMAYNDIGFEIFHKDGQADEAIPYFQKSLEINPANASAEYNLGDAFRESGKADEAITHYRKALQIKPDLVEAHFNLAVSFFQLGRMDEAIAQYRKVVEIKPDYAQAHNNLAVYLARQGRMDEAIQHFQKAVEIKPDFAEAQFNLASSYFLVGQMDKAILNFQKMLEIQPDHAQTQESLAWVLATCPQAALRDGNKAVGLAERANLLAGGANPVFLETLAAAYAEAGRFSEAVETAQHALRLLETQAGATLAGQLQAQLKLYQAGKPFHSPALTH
jgi:tetratricopeptide (TPR) repeat protein